MSLQSPVQDLAERMNPEATTVMPPAQPGSLPEGARRYFDRVAIPVERLWYDGFVALRAGLTEIPTVISALAKWVLVDAQRDESSGFWRLIVTVESKRNLGDPALVSALWAWRMSGRAGALLESYVFTRSGIKTAPDGTIDGRPVYVRGHVGLPDWLERIGQRAEAKERDLREAQAEDEEEAVQSRPNPRGPGE